MAKPVHAQQGFTQDAGVNAQVLQRTERKTLVQAFPIRLACVVLLALPPLFLFFSLPGHLAWLTSVVAIGFSAIAAIAGTVRRNGRRMPLRMPDTMDRIDPGDEAPGGGLRKARGNVYLGICKDTNEQVWISQDDILRHILLLGTTGAGKTATLLGIASNLLAAGGGLVYSDAKGSTQLYYQVHGMARRLGRDDDVLVMNFQTSQSSGKKREKRSNSLNLFQGRSSDALLQVFLSLLPASGGEGGNAVFSQRAEALMAAVLPPLCWLRDELNWTLSLKLLADALSFDGAVGLCCIEEIPEGKVGELRAFIQGLPGMTIRFTPDGAPPATPQQMRGIPPQQRAKAEEARKKQWASTLAEAAKEALETRTLSVAGQMLKQQTGWVPGEQTLTQFGYSSMYFTRSLQSLVITYGDLYDTAYGEIRLEDVISQRRIMVIVLPVLEKSPAELRQLAKLLLSSIRGAVALGLGKAAEGSRVEAIDSSPTKSETISLIIPDEYAYQITEGFAAVAAQARSLGVGVVFAGQDLAGIKKAGAEEAGQVIANTLTKVFMRLAEPDDTAELALKLGGKVHVSMASSGRVDSNGVRPEITTQYQERNRVDITDLTAQTEGESHIIFGERLVRTRMFYPGDLTSPYMLFRRFVAMPGITDIQASLARADR